MSEHSTGNDQNAQTAPIDGALAAALFEIASEVSVLRDRLYAAEEMLQKNGVLAAGAIDAHGFSVEAAQRCDEDRRDFVARILKALAGKSTASRPEGADQ